MGFRCDVVIRGRFVCAGCGKAIEVAGLDEVQSLVDCPDCGQGTPIACEGRIEDGMLVACPICGCEEMFQRKDFPQGLGVVIVASAAVASVALFAYNYVIAAWACLASAVLFDLLLYAVLPGVTTCYRCAAQFRGVRPNDGHGGFDLATLEKYARDGEEKKG